MKTQTFTGTANYSEIATAPGELVRVEEALVFLPPMEEMVRPRPWLRRFLLAATLGVVGGFAAAIAINDNPESAPLRSVSPPSQVAAASPLPIETTSVTVEPPPVIHRAVTASGRANAGEEVTRLKTRNRRLEALVRVLRQSRN